MSNRLKMAVVGTLGFGAHWVFHFAVVGVAAAFIGLSGGGGESPVGANGGNHGECTSVVSIEGTENFVSYDAGDGVIDGVCIKAGNTVQHELVVADFANECYTVRGIGTNTVVVTRVGEGRQCQGLSHIDLQISSPTPTPEPTPTPTATPTASVTPTPAPSVTPTPTVGPEPLTTPTPTGITPVATSTSAIPLALPSTGGEGPVGGPEAGIGAFTDSNTRSNAKTWALIMVGATMLIGASALTYGYFTRRS